jgi:hypothetical protein
MNTGCRTLSPSAARISATSTAKLPSVAIGVRADLSGDVEPGHCRRPLDKQCEKIERLRRKVGCWAASVEQLPCRGVESECTESDAQNDLRSGRGTKGILVRWRGTDGEK